MKKKHRSFTGYTHKDIFTSLWTKSNILNICTVISKTRKSAIARYGKDIVKIKLIIEKKEMR